MSDDESEEVEVEMGAMRLGDKAADAVAAEEEEDEGYPLDVSAQRVWV
jgi:hypothetical protein